MVSDTSVSHLEIQVCQTMKSDHSEQVFGSQSSPRSIREADHLQSTVPHLDEDAAGGK